MAILRSRGTWGAWARRWVAGGVAALLVAAVAGVAAAAPTSTAATWCDGDPASGGSPCAVCSTDGEDDVRFDLTSLQGRVFEKSVTLAHRSQPPNQRAVMFSFCPVGGGDGRFSSPPPGFASTCSTGDTACFCHADFSDTCAPLGGTGTVEITGFESRLITTSPQGAVDKPYPSMRMRWHRGSGECGMGCGSCGLTVYGVCDPRNVEGAIPEFDVGDPRWGMRGGCGLQDPCETCVVVAASAFCTSHTTCLRGCSGHGRCLSGECSCDQEWQGSDCSEAVGCRKASGCGDRLDDWWDLTVDNGNPDSLTNGEIIMLMITCLIVVVAAGFYVSWRRRKAARSRGYKRAETEDTVVIPSSTALELVENPIATDGLEEGAVTGDKARRPRRRRLGPAAAAPGRRGLRAAQAKGRAAAAAA
eukprot:CAMPEP_0203823784 /NCGR_PEP_ID=MMETSP0115-20131106/50075_1 /ASSEMBLY_ACC=CAM_ASM_000227 /TAXON_ID=33651 /ORGANISM="Bicosoecid sp, Strain ms1" /LENGTH=416 /DNA_ID=CAMNT_0050732817 /DNA_START=18 /DNA_END=1265 /DNA_ORIENTATION=+